LRGFTYTVFGWSFRVAGQMTRREAAKRARSARNFPVQANSAEILRLACIYMSEAGLLVCCPVHDAVLIMAPIERIEADVALAESLMQKASALVLGGFPLRTEAKIVRYPDRYMDEKRGRSFWEKVMSLL
jgi:DNA polymerase I